MVAKGTSQKGQNFIEFAMILPVLSLLLLGVIEVGRALYMANVTSRLSREGANLVSRNPDTRPEALVKVKNILLASATPPLDMGNHGAIILSIFTVNSSSTATLTQQEKYDGTGGRLRSRLPNYPVNAAVPLRELSGVLNNERLEAGEAIAMVEVMYEYLPIGNWGFSFGQPLKLYNASTFFRRVI